MIVVGDTNFYRNLVHKNKLYSTESCNSFIKKLKEIENKKGIKKAMSTTVARELISHLKDNEDSESYKDCLFASKLLYDHCSEEDNTNYLLPLPESQNAKSFFNVENKNSIEHQKNISSLLNKISISPDSSTISNCKSTIDSVIDFLDQAEKSLIQEMQCFAKSIDPSFSDWTLFCNDSTKRRKYIDYIRNNQFKKDTATAYLTALRLDLYSQSISTENICNNHIKQYLETNKVALKLRISFFEKFLTKNDLFIAKNRNFIWDEQIIQCVGKSSSNDNYVLLTDDKMMIGAIIDVFPHNSSSYYNSFNTYLKALGF